MSKQGLYSAEAERLYVHEQLGFAEIAGRLPVSERSLRTWAEQGDWQGKRQRYLGAKKSFHEDLYGFGRTLLNNIQADMDAGLPVDAGRLYTLTRLIPLLMKTKDYEAVVQAEQAKSQGSSAAAQSIPDTIMRLIEEKLGG